MSRVFVPRRDLVLPSRFRQKQGGFIMNPFRYGPSGTPLPGTWTTTIIGLDFEGSDGATTTTDTSGKTHTFVGNAQIDTAQAYVGSSSLLLDSVGDYLTTPSVTDLQTQGDFRIQCAIRPAALTNLRCICSKRPSGTAKEFAFHLTTGGGLQVAAWDSGGALVVAATSATGLIAANAWTLVSAQKIGSDWWLGVNGYIVATATQTGSPVGTADTFKIGRDPNNTARDWDGHIDQFRYLRP